jgi:hypothetical protein
MAAPRPKKKAPVKKKPSFLRKDTSRPARDAGKGGMRQATMDSLKQGPSQPQGPEAPRYPEKIGPKQPTAQSTTAKAPKAGVARGLIKKIPVVGAAAGFIIDSSPAGTGSTVPGQAQKAVQKKMKREIRQGPKLAVTGVKEGTTRRLAPTGSRKPAPGANYSGQSSAGSPFSKGKGSASLPKVSGDALRRAGAGTYTASYDVKSKKTGPATTAATTAAKASSSTSKASGVGRQTRYQRNETAMEQKRSSNRPKKSIFSLFRKG